MQLFYNPTLDTSTTSFFFSPEESKHISRVLRKKEGDVLHITDGRGILYEAELLNTDSRKCSAQIIKIQRTEANATEAGPPSRLVRGRFCNLL